MTLSLEFTVDGQPVPKGRPRLSTRSGFARAYTPAKTVAYERKVASAAKEAMAGREPTGLPVAVSIRLGFQVPASWTKARKAQALEGRTYPGRIDVDNVAKAVLDGMLAGGVMVDDALVVDLRVSKRYAIDPGALVAVREVSDAYDDGRRDD